MHAPARDELGALLCWSQRSGPSEVTLCRISAVDHFSLSRAAPNPGEAERKSLTRPSLPFSDGGKTMLSKN